MSRRPLTGNAIFKTSKFIILLGILALLVYNIASYISLPPDYPKDKYNNLILAIILLLNHLAFAYDFPRRIRLILTVAAVTSLVFGSVKILFFS